MTAQHQPASECPSCGRFVGPYGRCPYCGAGIGQRMVVRTFKYGSLVLAIGGLAVLLFAAAGTKVPAIEVGSLVGTMNWAYVRTEGVVTRQPTYDPASGALRFWLWDGTGEILVIAYHSEAETLRAEGLVPVMGDHVAVEGTLRVKEDFQYLVLDVPQNTGIRPTEPVQKSIAQVDLDLLYQKVMVQGVIRDDRTPYEGLRILTLRDSTGQIDVTLLSGSAALHGEVPSVRVGQSVQVSGAVDQYKGMAQISVGRGEDLQVLDQAIVIASLRHLGELSAMDVGTMALVEGMVVKVDPFSAGVKLTLDDASGQATMLLWQDLYDSLTDRTLLVAGSRVRAQGEVSEYRGDLEIIPHLPSDVEFLVAGEPVALTRYVGDLEDHDAGQIVEVEGVLRTLQTFSAGVKGTLEDATGAVTLVLWQDVYDSLPDQSRLMPGAILRVQGEVALYRDALEIIPQTPVDLAVTGFMELPKDQRTIDQVTTGDVGRRIEVAGQIVETRPFSKGIRCTLDDGTGTLALLIWQNLYERLPDHDLLEVGARFAVQGDVAEYQGHLEIVPQMPADVRLIAPAELAIAMPTSTVEAAASVKVSSVPTGTHTTSSTKVTPEPSAQPSSLPEPTATATPSFETRVIGAISSGDVGRTFAVARASIGDVDFFSKGVKYTLTDSSGSIILLLWQNVVEEIADRYDLVPGSEVQVTGRIEEFAGDLEIVPGDGTGITLLSRGERLPIEERQVNTVTPSDEGRIFTVQGTVLRTEGSGWLKAWLGDGTGEILVFVPERTVPYLPEGVGTGVKLRVTGAVDIYQGIIEIIPLAGADVKVEGS